MSGSWIARGAAGALMWGAGIASGILAHYDPGPCDGPFCICHIARITLDLVKENRLLNSHELICAFKIFLISVRTVGIKGQGGASVVYLLLDCLRESASVPSSAGSPPGCLLCLDRAGPTRSLTGYLSCQGAYWDLC